MKKVIIDDSSLDEISAEEELKELEELLFRPVGKEPYYLSDRALKNLQDLVDNLEFFIGHEGDWVADWLEYLGDKTVAENIHKSPGDFKLIVIERFNELKPRLSE
jgi:hypothetical protein